VWGVTPDIERLYREHRAGLVRLVERELHDRDDAEDVVQTAFLDAQRALERGTIPRNARAWLAAIALNAGRRLRCRRLNAELLEEYAVEEASGLPEIRAALAVLPREQRAAVLYRDLLGLSYVETAEQMGTSVGAVTMLLHRGRQRLRQTLGVTVGGVGLWRWLKRGAMPQIAVAKGAAAVVVTAGLATSGVVAARAVARVGADVTAAPATRSALLPAAAGRTTAGARPVEIARPGPRTVDGTKPSALAPTPGSAGGTSSAAPSTSVAAAATPPAPAPGLRLPTVRLPKVQIPTLPATVAATVTVSTPMTTATVTAVLSTTATVTTPITTVTLPIP
jgi:RNA polymerase sigma-70 factor (ECF subfamily)